MDFPKVFRVDFSQQCCIWYLAICCTRSLTSVQAVLSALPQIFDDAADVAQAAVRQLQVRSGIAPVG